MQKRLEVYFRKLDKSHNCVLEYNPINGKDFPCFSTDYIITVYVDDITTNECTGEVSFYIGKPTYQSFYDMLKNGIIPSFDVVIINTHCIHDHPTMYITLDTCDGMEYYLHCTNNEEVNNYTQFV
jgi:hypothetical protein